METKLTGKAVVVGDNIDTDQIYPGCYLALTDPKEPIALLSMGAKAVLADSFARIFFRNAVNLGLLPVVCKGIREHAADGQTLTLDLEQGTVAVEETGETFPCEQLGEQAMKILEAGGIKPLMRERFGKTTQ